MKTGQLLSESFGPLVVIWALADDAGSTDLPETVRVQLHQSTFDSQQITGPIDTGELFETTPDSSERTITLAWTTTDLAAWLNGAVSCPRYALSPPASRIEMVDVDDVFGPVMRYRAVSCGPIRSGPEPRRPTADRQRRRSATDDRHCRPRGIWGPTPIVSMQTNDSMATTRRDHAELQR